MSSKRGVIRKDATGENIRIRLRGEDNAGQLAVIEEVVAGRLRALLRVAGRAAGRH